MSSARCRGSLLLSSRCRYSIAGRVGQRATDPVLVRAGSWAKLGRWPNQRTIRTSLMCRVRRCRCRGRVHVPGCEPVTPRSANGSTRGGIAAAWRKRTGRVSRFGRALRVTRRTAATRWCSKRTTTVRMTFARTVAGHQNCRPLRTLLQPRSGASSCTSRRVAQGAHQHLCQSARRGTRSGQNARSRTRAGLALSR